MLYTTKTLFSLKSNDFRCINTYVPLIGTIHLTALERISPATFVRERMLWNAGGSTVN